MLSFGAKQTLVKVVLNFLARFDPTLVGHVYVENNQTEMAYFVGKDMVNSLLSIDCQLYMVKLLFELHLQLI